MKHIKSIDHIRTVSHIRTRVSAPASTGAGHHGWPRLKETEQLQANEKKLPVHIRRNWR